MNCRLMLTSFLWLAICSSQPILGQERCTNAGFGRVIEQFEFQGSLAEAVFNVGKKANICFALRSLDARAFTVLLSLSRRDADPRSILQALMEQLPGYSFRETRDVVEVGRLGALTPNSAFVKTVSFVAPRAPLRAILNGLAMQVAVDSDPNMTGFAGHFYPGAVNNLVGPIQERQQV